MQNDGVEEFDGIDSGIRRRPLGARQGSCFRSPYRLPLSLRMDEPAVELNVKSRLQNLLEVSKLPPNSARLPDVSKAGSTGLLTSIRVLGFHTRMHQIKASDRTERMFSVEKIQKPPRRSSFRPHGLPHSSLYR